MLQRSLQLLQYRLNKRPNGGIIGWLVIFSTFFIFAVVVGIEACFGVLIAAMVQDKENLKGVTASSLGLVSSMSIFMELVLGVPVGWLCVKIGVRNVALIGGLLLGLGLFLSSSVDRIELLYVTYSIISGTGLAFIYGAASIGVNKYFTTRLTFANGIAGIGAGVGVVILAMTIQSLIEQASWRTCMRLLGFSFSIIVCIASLFYIPIDIPAESENTMNPLNNI
jgi:MFS family permease